MKAVLFGLGISLFSAMALADNWQVNSQDSVVNFISVKKGDVAEVHKFTQVSGILDSSGDFSLSIPLSSVWTNVEIRDIRMKEVLFETAQYPSVDLMAKVDINTIEKLSIGEMRSLSLDAILVLHGEKKSILVNVRVAKLAQDKMLVMSESPIIVNAADFDLASGVDKLRELAGLSAISQAVPVSFVLTLRR
ncbi:YceI family protein [Shewanella psychrotolerans]|uniref:YceI family protein n=1 Tax=Shewanella psychrotolerans TaxID=2864206 RepID=UPI001C656A22|nr:YceI family protein [Shewanella psychrotolerans]QYK00067.1 YceI family protein [Shewanella psychrotolerans]